MRRASTSAILVIAFLAAGAASAAPRAVSGEVFVKLPGAAGAGQIEVESFSWGPPDSGVMLERTFVKSWSTSGSADAPAPTAGRASAADASASGLDREMKESGEKGGTEDINIGVGELQEARPGGATGVARKDMVMKGSKIGENSQSGQWIADVERPGAAGRGVDIARVDGETVSPSGQATGKRQHMPLRTRAHYDHPLGKGSVWIRVSSPWAACRVGARYPSLELAGGGKTYRLQDVTVAACGGTSADDRPTEEVAFYYNRIN